MSATDTLPRNFLSHSTQLLQNIAFMVHKNEMFTKEEKELRQTGYESKKEAFKL